LNEKEWEESQNPIEMWQAWMGAGTDKFGDAESGRKARLFGVACCLAVRELAEVKQNRQALEVSERYADGLASDADLHRARDKAIKSGGYGLVWATTIPTPARSLLYTLNPGIAKETTSRILRDTVMNPFKRLKTNGDWMFPFQLGDLRVSKEVQFVANGVYQDRLPDGSLDPVGLKVLSDAAEEAGGPPSILAHLRSPGKKYRGLWSLDLILGKE